MINDLSGLGKCSLTAAISVISAMGVQAVPLPTAVLSNQTGYDSYFCDDYTEKMDRIMAEWEKRGFQPDGIYTGFLAGEAQAEKILSFLNRFSGKDTLVLVDPIMGDQGKAYGIFTDELCSRMRSLAKRAQVITPNLTEALLLLYGRSEMEVRYEALYGSSLDGIRKDVEALGQKLCQEFELEAAVITGIDQQEKGKPPSMGNLVSREGRAFWAFAEKKGGSYSGTGDLFASILSAGMVKGVPMEHCVEKAAEFLSKAIGDAVAEGTDRNDGVCFETYLHELWEIGKKKRGIQKCL